MHAHMHMSVRKNCRLLSISLGSGSQTSSDATQVLLRKQKGHKQGIRFHFKAIRWEQETLQEEDVQRGTQFLWPTERQLAFNCGTASNDGCVSWVHKLVLNVNKCLSINWCFMGIVVLLVVSRNGSESMTMLDKKSFRSL